MAAICGSSSLFQLVSMAGDIPEYLVRMVRRPVPAEAVIPGTRPVIAFGDPRRAAIATVGINPSLREFHSETVVCWRDQTAAFQLLNRSVRTAQELLRQIKSKSS
jgi:hypothetical protein